MAPIWPQGQEAQVGVETNYPADNWASVYVPPNFDSSLENSYHLEWDEETISWTINDVEIVRYVRGIGPWISGPLVSASRNGCCCTLIERSSEHSLRALGYCSSACSPLTTAGLSCRHSQYHDNLKGSDWAGVADWASYPNPDAAFTHLSVNQ